MALNCRSKQVVEVIKDVEANIDKLPRSDQQDFRSKVLHLSKSFIDKFGMHKSSINQKIERGILTTKKFIRDNSDLICEKKKKNWDWDFELFKVWIHFELYSHIIRSLFQVDGLPGESFG